MKNTRDEIKNAIDNFNSILKQAEEKICELEGKFLDLIQSKENKGNGIKNRKCE